MNSESQTERERERAKEGRSRKCGEKRRAEKGETVGLIGIDTAKDLY